MKSSTDEQKTVAKKSENELIEEGLQAIYGNGKDVDFTKIDRSRNRLTNTLLTIVITLAVVAGVSWGAFFVYNKYFTQTESETFSLEIEVNDEFISGEASDIAIHYNNPSDVPITGLELDLRLPPSFIIDNLSPTPANVDDLIWSIGNLSAGSSGIIVVEGTWIAEVPSSTPIQVLANYRPANFNADFQDIETTYVQTRDSTLEATFEGPDEATPGETLSYEIEVRNEGAKMVHDVNFELLLPTGFFIESSDPEIEAGGPTTWHFETLSPEEPQTITFTGSFAGDVSGFQYFDYLINIESNEGRKLTQLADRGFTDLLTSDLSAQLIVNGGVQNVFTNLGESLRISVTLENSGETERENVELLLDFSAEKPLPIIWNNAELDKGTITSKGILWDNETIGTLEPGERKLFNIVVPIANAIGGQSDAFNLVAIASEGEIEVKSTPIEIAINSEAEITTSARYFTEDGTPLGSGPIPPQVEEKTSYRIYWTIKNSLHDLENVTVYTELPPNVSWEGQSFSDLGKISYQNGTGKVSWQIDRLPKDIEELTGYFTVSITPKEGDIGKFIKLTGESVLTAKDAQNQSDLSNRTDGTTTELPNDEFASGKGVVIDKPEA